MVNYMELVRLNFYTDGSTRGNPGPGGFGVVCLMDQESVERTGFGAVFPRPQREEI